MIVEFNLDVDGRKAAEDVREKVALIRPLLRDEVKEPRISRFDPASQPIFNVAVLSADGKQVAAGADHLGARRCCRSGSRTCAASARSAWSAASQREINLYLRPAALEALGIGVDQVVAAVSSENQELPLGAIRSREQERVVQINARLKRPEDFRDIVVARKAAAAAARRSSCGRWPTWSTGRRRSRAWRSTTASAPCCCRCRSRRARTPSRWSTACSKALDGRQGADAAGREGRGQPRQLALDPRLGGQRAAHADRGRGADGADRLPVPELLALDRHHRPDAADRADRHLPVHVRCSASRSTASR